MSQDPLVTIGAHTVNHKLLRKLSDEQALFELGECKRRLEEKINKKIEHFAYPYGHRKSYSQREKDLVSQLGYISGSTTNLKNVVFEDYSRLAELPRHVISGEMEEIFIVKALHSGIYGALFSSAK